MLCYVALKCCVRLAGRYSGKKRILAKKQRERSWMSSKAHTQNLGYVLSWKKKGKILIVALSPPKELRKIKSSFIEYNNRPRKV